MACQQTKSIEHIAEVEASGLHSQLQLPRLQPGQRQRGLNQSIQTACSVRQQLKTIGIDRLELAGLDGLSTAPAQLRITRRRGKQPLPDNLRELFRSQVTVLQRQAGAS